MSENPWNRPPRPRCAPRRRPLRRLFWWLALVGAGLLLLSWLMPGRGIDHPGEILGVLTLVGIGSLIVLSLRLHMRDFLRHVAIWSAIVLVLAGAWAFRHDILATGDRIAGSALPARGYTVGEAMVFERGTDGHFHVEGRIDGVAVRFLVDTGASKVALTRADAARLGIRPGPDAFVERYRTANGVVRAAPVMLESLEIGSIRIENVAASVTESDLGVSLLGMSYLNALSRFEMTGERLALHP